MSLLRPAVLIASVAALLLLALSTTQAQTPTPSPTLPSFCEAADIQGGGSRVIGNVEITLPEGTFSLIIPPPGTGAESDPNLLLCHQETSGILNLDSANCRENARKAPSTEAAAILDAISESCRIAPTATPSAPPIPCSDGEPVEGGRMVTVAEAIQVTLPPGEFVFHVNQGVVQICNNVAGYTLALRLADCGRPDIPPPNAPAQAVMAGIVESCTLLHPVTPVPSFSPLAEPGTITPPTTGDAGLLNADDRVLSVC